MEWVMSMLLGCARLADAESFAQSAGGEVVIGNITQANIALDVLNNWFLLLSRDILSGGADNSSIAKLTLNQPMRWFLAVLASILALFTNVVIAILTRATMVMCTSNVLLAKIAEDDEVHRLENWWD
jgi:hypothetical protein